LELLYKLRHNKQAFKALLYKCPRQAARNFDAIALLLSVSFLTLTAGAQPVAPTHTGPGVSTRVVTVPLSNNPNSNIKLNKKGKAVFNPKKLACKQIQGQSCHTITNTTSLTIDVYLNGSYFFTSAPSQINSFFYGGAGTYVYTIPNTNPKAKLTVTVTV
jgi:hypothetical protein